MSIILDGKYSNHIYFFTKLLHQEEMICDVKNGELINIYDDIAKTVSRESGYYITGDMLLTQINSAKIVNKNPYHKTVINCNGNLQDITSNVFKLLCPNISYHTFDPKTIEYTIELYFNRKTVHHELKHHMLNNKNIDMFTWLLILSYCQEGRAHNKDVFFKTPIDTKLKIAVIFCGYVRNYRYTVTSQKRIIDNKIFDIFIHTYDDTGIKNNRRSITSEWLDPNSAKLDVESIKLHFNPKKIKVDNNKELLPSLSLRGKINPIFLFKYQAQDDATKYINSQLYSIYQAYKLISEYEEENNMKYDGIIKLRFDFNINGLDIDTIIRHVTNTSAVYWPHAKSSNHFHRVNGGLSGGCLSCDAGVEHDEHTNDICDIWFYANRELGQKTCELFLHGENILRSNQEHNLRMLREHPEIKHEKKEDYIYIERFEDIDKYTINFYPEGLYRRHLKGIPCLSSMAIQGKILG